MVSTYFSPEYRRALNAHRASEGLAETDPSARLATENVALRARVVELEALLEQATAPQPIAAGERRARR